MYVTLELIFIRKNSFMQLIMTDILACNISDLNAISIKWTLSSFIYKETTARVSHIEQ